MGFKANKDEIMRIAGGGSYIPRLSANQLIGTAARTRNSGQIPKVNSADPQQPIEELEALKVSKTNKTAVRRNVGPSLAELTPQPSTQRPQGFFSNEETTTNKDTEDLNQTTTDESSTEELENKGPENPQGSDENLTEEEQQEVSKLKARDAEVVAHEQAHKAVAGSLSPGPIHYDYTRGPDKVNYRSGGHVNINTSEGKTPEETLAKAEIIQRAALAPAQPSGQDRAVAAEAAQMASKARQEISEQRDESVKNGSEDKESNSNDASSEVIASNQDPKQTNEIPSNNDPENPEIKVPDFKMRKALSSYASMAAATMISSQFGSIRA